jgi:hypothetical protein
MKDFSTKIYDKYGYVREEFYLDYAKKRADESAIDRPEIFGRYGVRNDYWSAYSYGGEIKVIYIKRGVIERAKKERKFEPTKDNSKTAESERFSQSVSRSRARVFELAMCNEFQYFCTFTQSKELRDRFDLNAFRKDFTMLIRNLNRNRAENEKIRYLLIPEQHKDGAWHMHGLINGLSTADLREFKVSENIPKRLKDKIREGRKIYDWTAYRRRFGYFTCEKIQNSTACAKYVTKYISKDLQKSVRESGAHLYFASQGLKGRECIVKNSFEKCPFTEWDYENDYVKIKTISGVNPEDDYIVFE